MNEHFIKEIEIKNYKLFKDFKASGFGRVNLIGGKNNVGKTAFMEALFLYDSKDVKNLFERLLEIKTHRNIINNLLFNTTRNEDLHKLIKDNIGIKFGIFDRYNLVVEQEHQNLTYEENYEVIDGVVSISYSEPYLEIYTKNTIQNLEPDIDKNGDLFLASNAKKYSISDLINILDISFDSTKKRFSLNFISPNSNSNEEYENIIGQSKLENKYSILNDYLLKVFNIENIDIIKNKPMLKSNGKYYELYSFGQGIKTFINIISSILLLKEDIIFIDEIENGKHYTNLDKLWEIILTLSKKQNVQVFATTHSKECIESYARVAKKLDDKEIGFIELGINKYGKLDSIIMDNERLQRNIEIGNEVRGW